RRGRASGASTPSRAGGRTRTSSMRPSTRGPGGTIGTRSRTDSPPPAFPPRRYRTRATVSNVIHSSAPPATSSPRLPPRPGRGPPPFRLPRSDVHPGGTIRRGPPCIGEDTHEVLRRLLGMDDAEIASLEDAGVFT